ncbi:hypothetical protein SK128_026976 [Halocaridina rubra]|uniref:DRBM domain-containing protein n=1 Tax=Halocaridina rubra TaxID=373956 RepID=A0AAN8X5U7_HALRR
MAICCHLEYLNGLVFKIKKYSVLQDLYQNVLRTFTDQLGIAEKQPVTLQGDPSKKEDKPIIGNKNPISVINELKPGCKYVSSSVLGPNNAPIFTVSLEFFGATYAATAKSKRVAKRYASEFALKEHLKSNVMKETEHEITSDVHGYIDDKALMFLKKTRNVTHELIEGSVDGTRKYFAVRLTVDGETFEGLGESEKTAELASVSKALISLGLQEEYELGYQNERNDTSTSIPPPTSSAPTPVVREKDNALQWLNSSGIRPVFELVKEVGPPHKKTFFMKTVVAGMPFDGSGLTKKLAKLAAAIKIKEHMKKHFKPAALLDIKPLHLSGLPTAQR